MIIKKIDEYNDVKEKVYKFIKKRMEESKAEMINYIKEEDGNEILTIEEIKQQGISYDKMQGRPSVTVVTSLTCM